MISHILLVLELWGRYFRQ